MPENPKKYIEFNGELIEITPEIESARAHYRNFKERYEQKYGSTPIEDLTTIVKGGAKVLDEKHDTVGTISKEQYEDLERVFAQLGLILVK